MYLQTKTEVVNTEEDNLGLDAERIPINIVLKLSELIGVREFVEDGKMHPDRAVVILKTGEEYGILTPYRQIVALLCPPQDVTAPMEFPPSDSIFEPIR